MAPAILPIVDALKVETDVGIPVQENPEIAVHFKFGFSINQFDVAILYNDGIQETIQFQ